MVDLKFDYPTGFILWGNEEKSAIYRVIDSDWFTYGPETKALEEELAAYHGRRYCVAVNSGSSANEIAVAALFYKKDNPLKRGDAAIVPAIAWATTWSPLINRDLDLIVADCDDTWNSPIIDKPCINPKLVVSCPILGNPSHISGWYDYAMVRGIYCIEDACESVSALTEDGRRIGTLGHMSTLSFYMSHQIAGIEGGAVLVDDQELYRLLLQLRAHGWTRDTDAPYSFEDEYTFVLPAGNVRPLEINSAVQREQLKKLSEFIKARQDNFDYFLTHTSNLFITSQKMTGSPSCFGISFTVDGGRAARALLARELRAAGVDCRLPTGGSFTRHPIGAPWANQPTPKADAIHTSGMFLGNAPYDIRHLIDRAVTVMRRVL